MVKKVRKEMPQMHAEKHAKKPGVKDFVNKKPKDYKQKREKNQYQFQGFYDRLKSLDMKQSHAMQASHAMDTLLNYDNEQEMDDQLKSNFIAFLRTEKMTNKTLDFHKICKKIEPLAYSQALIVLNKNKILSRLLKVLTQNQSTAET